MGKLKQGRFLQKSGSQMRRSFIPSGNTEPCPETFLVVTNPGWGLRGARGEDATGVLGIEARGVAEYPHHAQDSLPPPMKNYPALNVSRAEVERRWLRGCLRPPPWSRTVNTLYKPSLAPSGLAQSLSHVAICRA